MDVLNKTGHSEEYFKKQKYDIINSMEEVVKKFNRIIQSTKKNKIRFINSVDDKGYIKTMVFENTKELSWKMRD